MARKIIIVTIILSLGLTGFLVFGKNAFYEGDNHVVTLTERGFEPKELTIKKGDSVEFKDQTGKQFWPASDIHPTHGIYPEFDPLKPIEASSLWKFQFNKKGAWKYHDHLTPSFRGVINVI